MSTDVLNVLSGLVPLNLRASIEHDFETLTRCGESNEKVDLRPDSVLDEKVLRKSHGLRTSAAGHLIHGRIKTESGERLCPSHQGLDCREESAPSDR